MSPTEIESWFAQADDATDVEARHEALLGGLEAGAIRAAEREVDGTWSVRPWVKAAILHGFRRTSPAMIGTVPAPSIDKTAFPPRHFSLEDGVRLVPGSATVRRGAHIGRGVVLMPPSYVNVGAFVGPETMIDSHALVGSCAQIGARVHVSAGAQIGGVLEPVGARPVIVEDEVFIGGCCGLFEGVVVRARAVIAAGVQLTSATPIYDLVNEQEYRGEIPPGAVVVGGTRPARGPFAAGLGLAVAAAIIVKYRDESTATATLLEGALR